VPRHVLERTVSGLRARSAAWRESACVWTGARDGQVTDVHFHHELGDDQATALSLELPEDAKFALYEHLAARGESLLALLHTHPEEWVGLSRIDQRNQVSSRIGFWSIVLPYYAAKNWNQAEVGFHIRCDRGWRRIEGDALCERFRVEAPGG
jgi:hypothetical protein